MASYSKDVKLALRVSYISGLSMRACASKHNVPYDTARNWKRKAKGVGDDWDVARTANRLSSGGIKELTSEILEEFICLFQTTIDDLKKDENISAISKSEAISRLADSYVKTVKAAGNSNPELSRLATAMDVLKNLSDFITIKHPKHQIAFMEILEPFGKELVRIYG